MDEITARQLTTEIQDSIVQIGATLNRIRDEGGYTALGYDTFTEYLEQEIGRYSRQHLYRLMACSTIEMRLSPLGNNWKLAHLMALREYSVEYQYIIAQMALSYAAACNISVTKGLIKSVANTLLEAANTGCVDLGDGESSPILSAIDTAQIERNHRQLEHIQTNAKRRILFSKQPARVFGRTLQFTQQFEIPDSTDVLVTIYEVDNGNL